MDNFYQQLALHDIARGDAQRTGAIQRASAATGDFYDRRDAALRLNDARDYSERLQTGARAYADRNQQRQFDETRALQVLRGEQANRNAKTQVKAQEDAYRRREMERAVRELVMRGYSPTDAERKAIDAGDPTPFLKRATGEQIDSAGANLDRFDSDNAALEKAAEQNANDFKANREAWVKKKTSDTFLSQFSPDQVKEIQGRMNAKRGYPMTFERAAEEYAASGKVKGFVPMNQIESAASEEFDTMKDNPIVKAHSAKARQVGTALQRNTNERSDFLQTNPHAQQALMKRSKRTNPEIQSIIAPVAAAGEDQTAATAAQQQTPLPVRTYFNGQEIKFDGMPDVPAEIDYMGALRDPNPNQPQPEPAELPLANPPGFRGRSDGLPGMVNLINPASPWNVVNQVYGNKGLGLGDAYVGGRDYRAAVIDPQSIQPPMIDRYGRIFEVPVDPRESIIDPGGQE